MDLGCVTLPLVVLGNVIDRKVLWLNRRLGKPYFFSSFFKDERKHHFRLNLV